VTDGPFTTLYKPFDVNMLVVVKSNAGCIDKVLFSPNIAILPVKLVYFQGNLENERVTLQWKVAQNEASGRFEIERSNDGINFLTAGTVFPTTNADAQNYSYTETLKSYKIYYRLKMFDKNQTAKYSNAIVFQNANAKDGSFKIVNNPATDKLTLSYSSGKDQSVEIKVYDLAGRMQMNQKTNVYQGSNFINLTLSSAFKTGMYSVEVRNASEIKTAKFVKQ
jgi:hypothetical protein